MRILFFDREFERNDLLLKATHMEQRWIPPYTKLNGRMVAGHYKSVHVNPDVSDADVLAGKGSHSQKLAWKKLMALAGFAALPDNERLPHILSLATDIQLAYSKASVISAWKAAVLAGKPPAPAQQKLIDSLTPEEKKAIYGAVNLTVPDAVASVTEAASNKEVIADLKADKHLDPDVKDSILKLYTLVKQGKAPVSVMEALAEHSGDDHVKGYAARLLSGFWTDKQPEPVIEMLTPAPPEKSADEKWMEANVDNVEGWTADSVGVQDDAALSDDGKSYTSAATGMTAFVKKGVKGDWAVSLRADVASHPDEGYFVDYTRHFPTKAEAENYAKSAVGKAPDFDAQARAAIVRDQLLSSWYWGAHPYEIISQFDGVAKKYGIPFTNVKMAMTDPNALDKARTARNYVMAHADAFTHQFHWNENYDVFLADEADKAHISEWDLRAAAAVFFKQKGPANSTAPNWTKLYQNSPFPEDFAIQWLEANPDMSAELFVALEQHDPDTLSGMLAASAISMPDAYKYIQLSAPGKTKDRAEWWLSVNPGKEEELSSALVDLGYFLTAKELGIYKPPGQYLLVGTPALKHMQGAGLPGQPTILEAAKEWLAANPGADSEMAGALSDLGMGSAIGVLGLTAPPPKPEDDEQYVPSALTYLTGYVGNPELLKVKTIQWLQVSPGNDYEAALALKDLGYPLLAVNMGLVKKTGPIYAALGVNFTHSKFVIHAANVYIANHPGMAGPVKEAMAFLGWATAIDKLDPNPEETLGKAKAALQKVGKVPAEAVDGYLAGFSEKSGLPMWALTEAYLGLKHDAVQTASTSTAEDELANVKLKEIADGHGGHYPGKAYKKLSKDPAWLADTHVHQLEQVVALAKQMQSDANDSSAVSGWMKAANHGKNPTDAQWLAFLSMDESKQKQLYGAAVSAIGSDDHLKYSGAMVLLAKQKRQEKLAAKNAKPAPAPEVGPKDGDTKPGANGATLVFHNGRWHIQGGKFAGGKLAGYSITGESLGNEGSVANISSHLRYALAAMFGLHATAMDGEDFNTYTITTPSGHTLSLYGHNGSISVRASGKSGGNNEAGFKAVSEFIADAAELVESGKLETGEQASYFPFDGKVRMAKARVEGSTMILSTGTVGGDVDVKEYNFDTPFKALEAMHTVVTNANFQTFGPASHGEVYYDATNGIVLTYVDGEWLRGDLHEAEKNGVETVRWTKAPGPVAYAAERGQSSAGNFALKPYGTFTMHEKPQPDPVEAAVANLPKPAAISGTFDEAWPSESPAAAPADFNLFEEQSLPDSAFSVYTNTTPGHNKQWLVTVYGHATVTKYGKIGAKLQQTIKFYPDDAAASKAASKLVSEKLKEGYVQVSTGVAVVKPDDQATVKPDDQGASKWSFTAKDFGFNGAPSLLAEVPGDERQTAYVVYSILDGSFEVGVAGGPGGGEHVDYETAYSYADVKAALKKHGFSDADMPTAEETAGLALAALAPDVVGSTQPAPEMVAHEVIKPVPGGPYAAFPASGRIGSWTYDFDGTKVVLSASDASGTSYHLSSGDDWYPSLLIEYPANLGGDKKKVSLSSSETLSSLLNAENPGLLNSITPEALFGAANLPHAPLPPDAYLNVSEPFIAQITDAMKAGNKDAIESVMLSVNGSDTHKPVTKYGTDALDYLDSVGALRQSIIKSMAPVEGSVEPAIIGTRIFRNGRWLYYMGLNKPAMQVSSPPDKTLLQLIWTMVEHVPANKEIDGLEGMVQQQSMAPGGQDSLNYYKAAKAYIHAVNDHKKVEVDMLAPEVPKPSTDGAAFLVKQMAATMNVNTTTAVKEELAKMIKAAHSLHADTGDADYVTAAEYGKSQLAFLNTYMTNAEPTIVPIPPDPVMTVYQKLTGNSLPGGTPYGPKEGDTKQGADGTLVFHDGRWHKQGSGSAAGPSFMLGIDPATNGYLIPTFSQKKKHPNVLADVVDFANSLPSPEWDQLGFSKDKIKNCYDHIIKQVAAGNGVEYFNKKVKHFKNGRVTFKDPAFAVYVSGWPGTKTARSQVMGNIEAIKSAVAQFYGKPYTPTLIGFFGSDGVALAEAVKKGVPFQAKATKPAPAPQPAPQPAPKPTPAPQPAPPKAAATPSVSGFTVGSSKKVAGMDTTDVASWKKVGSQLGSNSGGQYVDGFGQKWYCKFPPDPDVVKNEFLATKLYQMLGAEVPTLKLVSSNGKLGIASKWVDGIKKGSPEQLKAAPGALDFFAVDAFLANWDVVGMGYDNLMLSPTGHAVRVDAGGGLVYRAQGGKKGDAFADTPAEFEKMLDPSTSPQVASVFGGVTKEQMALGLKRINMLKPSQIEELVSKIGPGTEADKNALVAKLIARRSAILKKFGIRDQWIGPVVDETKIVIDPNSIKQPLNFSNWQGGGKGLSGSEHFNQQNTADSLALFQFALKGNLKALKEYKYDAVDKDSGASLGKKPIDQHPSKHIQDQWAALVQGLQSIAYPPVETLEMPPIGVYGAIAEVAAAAGSFGPNETVETVAAEHRFGYFMKLCQIDPDDAVKMLDSVNWVWKTTSDSGFISLLHNAWNKFAGMVKDYVHGVSSSGGVNHLWSQGKSEFHGQPLISLTRAIYDKSVEIPEGTQLWRWMDDDTANQQMTKMLLAAKPGLVLQNTDSMCSSFFESWGKTPHFCNYDNRAVKMRIRFAKGARGTPTYSTGSHTSEGEITTLPGQRYLVVGISKGGPSHPNGVIVDCIALPPDNGYVQQLGLQQLAKSLTVKALWKRKQKQTLVIVSRQMPSFFRTTATSETPT